MRILSLACAVTVCAFAAHAQIRVAPAESTYIDPDSGPLAKALFGRSGYFMIAGGVVLGGTAQFYLEQNGTDRPINPADVQPAAMGNGEIALTYDGAAYRIGMPAGLACPLGKFVDRGGIVAYTVPKFLDDDSLRTMMRIGLRHHRIAKEFDGTIFEPLLRAADFGRTRPLPPDLARKLSGDINTANGVDGFVLRVADGNDQVVGSLINTDAQVRYQVYLIPATHRVEIAGVPLRYYWQMEPGGDAAVFAVDELSQDWAAGTHLTDWSALVARATQFDVVNFYQVSGVFRQLYSTQPRAFAAATKAVCQ
jgi:hypothetical protein